MNGVIYARFSSDNQREESIEGQLRECNDFAKRNDIRIVDSYIDRALSAKTDNRPSFQKMIKDSSKGLFDVVIVWKLDRFSRNRIDSSMYKSILRKNGVKVISATENISDGPDGILLESVLEGMAEYYSAELSEKVKRGLTENALKCKQNGGTIPFGFIVDKHQNYQIDPISAPVVNKIFNDYANGITVKEIISYLDRNNIKTCRGNSFNQNAINRMLKNRKYIGEFHFGNITVPNGIPSIISDEIFDRVQKRLEKNRYAPASKKADEMYLLTTKLFCGKDNVFMVADSGTSKTGKVHKYYRCVNSRKKKCSKKPIKKEYIEDIVINQTILMLHNDKVIEYAVERLLERQGKENSSVVLLKKQINENQKAIDNMLKAIQQGIITESTKKCLEDLEETRANLNSELIKEETKKPILTKDEITCWLHKFRELDATDPKHRQVLVDRFVNSVYLYDDKIVINLNIKDGSRTIAFEDLESSDLYPFPPPYKNANIDTVNVNISVLIFHMPAVKSLETKAFFYVC